MQFTVYFVLCQCIIMCNYNDFAHAEPLIGETVRRLTETDYPYVVALTRIINDDVSQLQIMCIGTLISKKDVLTCEHCLLDEVESKTVIIAGSYNLTSGTKYFVYWWLTYDQWAVQYHVQIQFRKNDIAVIRLLTNVADEINPVIPAYIPPSDLVGLEVQIPTWTTSNTGETSDAMEVGSVTIISNADCKRKCRIFGHRDVHIPERMLCTFADPFVLLSQGDSGGPLLYNGNIVALNSGIYPPTTQEGTHDARRVNYHFGIYYYNFFIVHVLILE